MPKLDTTHLQQCITTLEASLTLLQKEKVNSIQYEVFRNATVKGYELTLEIAKTLLKKAIKPFFSSPKEVDALTFKDIFRHAAKHGFLSAEETQRWFEYRDNRNNTAHDYGVGFAETTLTLLPTFINDVKMLREKIANACI